MFAPLELLRQPAVPKYTEYSPAMVRQQCQLLTSRLQATYFLCTASSSNPNPVFDFTVESINRAALNETDMPNIWLSNQKEEGSTPFDQRTALVYSPIWRLRPGFHIEAEAKMITRRFIKSSVFRDIALYTDPVGSN
jgi:hypothetical protein